MEFYSDYMSSCNRSHGSACCGESSNPTALQKGSLPPPNALAADAVPQFPPREEGDVRWRSIGSRFWISQQAEVCIWVQSMQTAQSTPWWGEAEAEPHSTQAAPEALRAPQHWAARFVPAQPWAHTSARPCLTRADTEHCSSSVAKKLPG